MQVVMPSEFGPGSAQGGRRGGPGARAGPGGGASRVREHHLRRDPGAGRPEPAGSRARVVHQRDGEPGPGTRCHTRDWQARPVPSRARRRPARRCPTAGSTARGPRAAPPAPVRAAPRQTATAPQPGTGTATAQPATSRQLTTGRTATTPTARSLVTSKRRRPAAGRGQTHEQPRSKTHERSHHGKLEPRRREPAAPPVAPSCGEFVDEPQPPAALRVTVRESSGRQDRGTTAAAVGHLHPDASPAGSHGYGHGRGYRPLPAAARQPCASIRVDFRTVTGTIPAVMRRSAARDHA